MKLFFISEAKLIENILSKSKINPISQEDLLK
mgnify:CR=1 FL=1